MPDNSGLAIAAWDPSRTTGRDTSTAATTESFAPTHDLQ
jgi:hypothetical protein